MEKEMTEQSYDDFILLTKGAEAELVEKNQDS